MFEVDLETENKFFPKLIKKTKQVFFFVLNVVDSFIEMYSIIFDNVNITII